jgi:hypothetical protein
MVKPAQIWLEAATTTRTTTTPMVAQFYLVPTMVD